MSLIHKTSNIPGEVPVSTQLQQGEIIINLPDKKIYTKDDNDQIIELSRNDIDDIVKYGNRVSPDSVVIDEYASAGSCESTVIGYLASACPPRSVAVGFNTKVRGSNATSGESVVIGSDAEVKENSGYSVAIGTNSSIGENCSRSIAIGYESVTLSNNEIALGAYNKSVNNGVVAEQIAFSIASPISTPENRRNAFEIRKNGDVYIPKGNGDLELQKLQDKLGGSGDGGAYTLPAATVNTLGGVKVGNGVDVSSDGTISVNASGGGIPDVTGSGNYVRTQGAWIQSSQRTSPITVDHNGQMSVVVYMDIDNGDDNSVSPTNSSFPLKTFEGFVDWAKTRTFMNRNVHLVLDDGDYSAIKSFSINKLNGCNIRSFTIGHFYIDTFTENKIISANLVNYICNSTIITRFLGVKIVGDITGNKINCTTASFHSCYFDDVIELTCNYSRASLNGELNLDKVHFRFSEPTSVATFITGCAFSNISMYDVGVVGNLTISEEFYKGYSDSTLILVNGVFGTNVTGKRYSVFKGAKIVRRDNNGSINSQLPGNISGTQYYNTTFDNAQLLSTLKDSGAGDMYLADDGTYKSVTGGSTSYTLPTASATILGGVKIGSGLSITGDGTLSSTGGGDSNYQIAAYTANGVASVSDIGRIRTNGNLTSDITVEIRGGSEYPVGCKILFARTGTGEMRLLPYGSTVNCALSLRLRAQHSVVSIVKTDTNSWIAFGDFAAE